jgi:hypothetical protein
MISNYQVVRSGQLLALLTKEGKFAALGGFNSNHNRAQARFWNREMLTEGNQLIFLVTVKGRWLVGSKPKSKKEEAARKRRRRARKKAFRIATTSVVQNAVASNSLAA